MDEDGGDRQVRRRAGVDPRLPRARRRLGRRLPRHRRLGRQERGRRARPLRPPRGHPRPRPGSGTSPGCAARPSCPHALRADFELALLFRRIATVETDVDVGAVDDWYWTGPTRRVRRDRRTARRTGTLTRRAGRRSPTAADRAGPHRGRCHGRDRSRWFNAAHGIGGSRRTAGTRPLGERVGGVRRASCSPTSAPQVVMVEPAAGSPLRAHGLFDYLAGGKRVGRARRRRRRSRRGWPPPTSCSPTARRRGTPPPSTAGPTRRSLVDLSPFGRSGPYAELGRAATSSRGRWAATSTSPGSPDREPIWVPGPQAQLHAGAHAALRRPRRPARARAQRPRPGRRDRRPRRHAHRPRLAGVVVGGVRRSCSPASRSTSSAAPTAGST